MIPTPDETAEQGSIIEVSDHSINFTVSSEVLGLQMDQTYTRTQNLTMDQIAVNRALLKYFSHP